MNNRMHSESAIGSRSSAATPRPTITAPAGAAAGFRGAHLAADLLRRLGVTDLPEGQSRLFHVWNRREAMTKAVGGALFDKPTGDFGVCDLEAPEGYSAALALREYTPRIRYRGTLVLPSGTAKVPLPVPSQRLL